MATDFTAPGFFVGGKFFNDDDPRISASKRAEIAASDAKRNAPSVSSTLSSIFDPASAIGIPPALGSLFELIGREGKTDPQVFNRNLAASARDTQSQQDAARAGLARSGIGGSGVGAALQAAIGNAGASRASGLRANEASQAEDRRRGDLQLLLQLLIGPALQQSGIEQGLSINTQNLAAAEDRQNQNDILTLLGLGLNLIPERGSGPPGANDTGGAGTFGFPSGPIFPGSV